MNVSWLSSTGRQADLTLANMLPQSEVFGNHRNISFETRFTLYTATKEAFLQFFSEMYFYHQTTSLFRHSFFSVLCNQGLIQQVRLGGRSVSIYLVVKCHNGFAALRRIKFSAFHNTAVTKQWTTKWPYIANAAFRIVKIMVNKVTIAYPGFAPVCNSSCSPRTKMFRDPSYRMFLVGMDYGRLIGIIIAMYTAW